jgi:alkylhydroperoxidase family enzyme
MAQRIAYFDYEKGDPASKAAYDDRAAQDGGYVTNMKKTLLRSLPAFKALMEWYPLRRAAGEFVGPRALAVFCHAVSAQNDCLICSTFFVRELRALGVSPGEFEATEEEKLLEAFGRQLARDPNGVDDELFARLAARYTQENIVTLTAFGALMAATNVINNALKVELDDGLQGYLEASHGRRI